MTTTKALAKLYKTITGSEGRNSAAKIISDLADNWDSTAGKKADAVAEAAGSNVTKAEFKALLDALKAAGLMKTS